MTTTLTTLEVQGLQGILDSEFHDGNDPIKNPVWTWSANPFGNKKTFSGVVSSLVKKGLVKSSGYDKDDVIYITQAGWDALQQAKA